MRNEKHRYSFLQLKESRCSGHPKGVWLMLEWISKGSSKKKCVSRNEKWFRQIKCALDLSLEPARPGQMWLLWARGNRKKTNKLNQHWNETRSVNCWNGTMVYRKKKSINKFVRMHALILFVRICFVVVCADIQCVRSWYWVSHVVTAFLQHSYSSNVCVCVCVLCMYDLCMG